MAFDIFDRKICELSTTKWGIDLICEFIKDADPDAVIRIKPIKLVSPRDTEVLVQCKLKGRDDWTNTVGIGPQHIYVNPVSDKDGNSVCRELRDYINSFTGLYRDKILGEIIDAN
jgi:hypothetical protein